MGAGGELTQAAADKPLDDSARVGARVHAADRWLAARVQRMIEPAAVRWSCGTAVAPMQAPANPLALCWSAIVDGQLATAAFLAPAPAHDVLARELAFARAPQRPPPSRPRESVLPALARSGVGLHLCLLRRPRDVARGCAGGETAGSFQARIHRRWRR